METLMRWMGSALAAEGVDANHLFRRIHPEVRDLLYHGGLLLVNSMY